ncbi:early nodulin-like protein 1 [Impatiens glandulifera]|uniref:early nodulin-like protein 1 n=1 Tax=Impatiens glandulifera TaxID=253017 RepID=UPI001FB04D45|nr:early nodulin-like protein 1 [Impatiens glandulifera]
MAFSSSSSLLLLLSILTIINLSNCKEILIGGKPDAWIEPTSSDQSNFLNIWAQKSRFQIGDSILWNYDGDKDSVLEVNKRDYITCNTSNPIEVHKDGDTKVKLERSGPFYFISGAQGHCEKGQKVIIVVMSRKHHLVFAPAPAPVDGPAVAPTSGGSRNCYILVVAFLGFVLTLF